MFTPFPTPQNEADLPEIPQGIYEESIIKFSAKEVKATIDNNINPKKSFGFDLITGKMIRELPQEGSNVHRRF